MNKIDFLEPALNAKFDSEKGLARLIASLEWIYRWRYTTPDLVKNLLQIKNNHHYKLISGWEEKGFIRRVKTAHLRIRNLIIITQRGAEFLQAHSRSIISAPLTDKTKISLTGVQHCIATQSLALFVVEPDTLFESEHELRLKQSAGQKVPDFTFINPEYGIIAVEVELSAKSTEQTEIAFSQSLAALNDNKYDQLIYTSSSKAILRKYEKLSKRKSIGIWLKDTQTKKWYEDRNKFLDPSHFNNRIAFRFDLVDYFKAFIG